MFDTGIGKSLDSHLYFSERPRNRADISHNRDYQSIIEMGTLNVKVDGSGYFTFHVAPEANFGLEPLDLKSRAAFIAYIETKCDSIPCTFMSATK